MKSLYNKKWAVKNSVQKSKSKCVKEGVFKRGLIKIQFVLRSGYQKFSYFSALKYFQFYACLR